MKKLGVCAAVLAMTMVGCDGGGATTDTGVGTDTGGGADTGGGTDAGTDAGGTVDDAGGTADTGGGTDTGMTMTDAGLMPGAALVTLTETCPAFTACGGEGIEGTWAYQSICIEFSEIEDQFPAICDPAMVLSGGGSATGTIEITATEVTRTISTTISGVVQVGGTCAAICNLLGNQIEMMLDGTTAECSNATGACLCDITFTSEVDETNTYTIAGGDTIVTGTGPDERSFEYCIEDDGSLRVHEVGGEPGTSTSLME